MILILILILILMLMYKEFSREVKKGGREVRRKPKCIQNIIDVILLNCGTFMGYKYNSGAISKNH